MEQCDAGQDAIARVEDEDSAGLEIQFGIRADAGQESPGTESSMSVRAGPADVVTKSDAASGRHENIRQA